MLNLHLNDQCICSVRKDAEVNVKLDLGGGKKPTKLNIKYIIHELQS